MPCYRSRKRFVSPYMPACDETRPKSSSSVHLPVCDVSYAARHRPYCYSHRFTFEPGNIDLPVPRTPVIVPRDVIATTFDDLDDEFELEEEEVEVSDEENELDAGEGEGEDEDENVVEANHAALLDFTMSVKTFGADSDTQTHGYTATEEKGSKRTAVAAEDASSQPLYGYMHSAKSKRKFGSDAFRFEEMGPNARVFQTYLDERAIFDANMIGESSGRSSRFRLFSAVVTTFVVQTSQSLQVDYAEISANLLFEIINIQRALASGISSDIVAPSPLNPNMPFIATTMSLSLATARVDAGQEMVAPLYSITVWDTS
ncbi:hypothetical protein EDD85DRAFT_788218 [Armillaria nabsnona]|nr:hypothetical protein EDD85DRAFT_788218 [Armillaria nabsnona]